MGRVGPPFTAEEVARGPDDSVTVAWWAYGGPSVGTRQPWGDPIDMNRIACQRLQAYADEIEQFPEFDAQPAALDPLIGPPHLDSQPVPVGYVVVTFGERPSVRLTVEPLLGYRRSETARLAAAVLLDGLTRRGQPG
jgi:hypothetical protein